MYLFFKLVALGVIRLFPASQFCGKFELFILNAWEMGSLYECLKHWYFLSRELLRIIIRICNACIDSKAQAVANCCVHLLVILLGKYAGKATTIKKEKRRMVFCFSQHRWSMRLHWSNPQSWFSSSCTVVLTDLPAKVCDNQIWSLSLYKWP